MQNQHWKNFNLFIYNPENKVIESFVKHIYNKSLSDFLAKILNQDILKSDYKNEVISFIILNEELKQNLILSIVNQIKEGEFEAKLNATQVLKDLIDSNKNFSFRDPGIQKELFEIALSEDSFSQRCAFSVLD